MIESMFIDFAVAQDSGANAYPLAPPVHEGKSDSGHTPTEGDPSAAGAGAQGSGGGFSPDFFMILMLVIIAMIGFSFMSQRKQKKRQQAMLESVGKRAVVQTIGGIIGTVVDVRGDRIVLNVHEGTNSRLTIARSAVQQTLDVSKATDHDDHDDYDDQDDQDDYDDQDDHTDRDAD